MFFLNYFFLIIFIVSCAEWQERAILFPLAKNINSFSTDNVVDSEQNSDDLVDSEQNPESDIDNGLKDGEQTKEQMLTGCAAGLADNTLKEAKRILKFETNAQKSNQCRWLKSKKNGQIRGLRKDPKALAIPTSQVVCSMALSSMNEFRYDDAIILTLNDMALAWGNLQIEKLDNVEGAYVFNEDKIIGSGLDGKQGCIDGHDQCEIPKHDNKGKLAISFQDEVNQKIMSDIEESGGVFDLITFGDNNEEVDCTHTGLDLEITYKYYEKVPVDKKETVQN